MSNKIKILNENLINQIAAGEVVEKPASVIKELVENSIDAGAKNIEIQTLNGGKSLISITDDGAGMSREDLELSVERHTTSKLNNENLFDIHTFGFRGEALASIASVSEIKISTNDSKESWELSLEGGKNKTTRPTSISQGTKIEVSNLFYATPARLKFLKSEKSENSAIIETVQKLAIAYPNISINLNGKIKFIAQNGSKESALLERLKEVLGNEFEENAIPVNIEKHGVKITGYICRPTYNKANSLYQFLFVNNRPVKDKLLLSGLRAGYMDVLERGRFPVVALFIEVDPSEVDVNVHPAKTEVRFQNAVLIRNIIVSSIRQLIAESTINPASSDINRMLNSKISNDFSSIKPMENIPTTNHNFSGFSGDFKRVASPTNRHNFTTNNFSTAAVFENSTNNYGENSTIQQSDFNNESHEESDQFPLGIALGNLGKNFIIAKTSDQLVLIDQHACHERIVYEKLKNNLLNKENIATQRLLIPEIIELNQRQINNLMEQQEELKNFGLHIDMFGINEIAVSETPAILGDFDIKTTIKDLADEAEEFSNCKTIEDKLNFFIKTYACHTSIRAGKILSENEMNALLREIEKTPNAGQCNHGRPTYIKLTISDLEKLFGRK